jgi:hypothetical protein
MCQESLCVPCWGFVLQEENASLPSVKGKPNARVSCASQSARVGASELRVDVDAIGSLAVRRGVPQALVLPTAPSSLRTKKAKHRQPRSRGAS